MVPHNILLKKLQANGISGDLFQLLKSYLQNRQQFTVVNGCSSERASVESGVPQGFLLGPQLFSLNINDLPDYVPDYVQDGEIDMFADDSTGSEICDDHQEAFTKAQGLLDQVDSYSKRNGFQIHTDRRKREVMFISRKVFVGPLPDFKLGEKSIFVSSTVKCLGLLIDNKLSWDP